MVEPVFTSRSACLQILQPSLLLLLFSMIFVGFPSGSAIKNPHTTQKTQQTKFNAVVWEDPLEEGMSTHSSILAWRIPWAKELNRLQSIGSQ